MASTGSSSSAVTAEAAPTHVDLVVGLVSHNNAGTALTVIAAVRDGMVQHLDGAHRRFVLADCGSTDDTSARVRDALRADGNLIEVSNYPA